MDEIDDRDSLRWVRRGIAAVVVVGGWVFIAGENHFHISAPVVFVCLGFLAVVATVYNLWRTGAVAVERKGEEDDSTWARPAGATAELEREKRTLLKAIKEAEFDHEMGKLSQRDADGMIATYKARVFEVYREIDRLQNGVAGSVREQILREVKLRLEVDARSQKKGEANAKKAGKKAKANGAVKPAAEPAAQAEPAAAEPAAEAAADHSLANSAHDDALDADSTTAIEPARDAAPARQEKEATP